MTFKLQTLVSPRYGVSVLSSALLLPLALTTAQAQWVSTATKALPLKDATLISAVAPSTPMHIVVSLQMRNAAQVQSTLRSGQTLTVSQFLANFAPTTAQVDAVENYLSSYGFKNLTVEPNRLLVQGDATAAEVQAAFNTQLAQFSQGGKTVFANTLDAQVQKSLQGTVLAVLGLNNISAMHLPMLKKSTTATCSVPVCPPALNTAYGPQDYQIAYDARYPADAGAKSNLQKLDCGNHTPIGIIVEGNLGTVSKTSPNGPGQANAGSTGVVHDLYLYEKNFALPYVPVSLVYAGIFHDDTSGADEWDLDSQTSTGIANQVSHLYFYIATSLTDSDIGLAINKAVADNSVKAFNMSFGECESFPYLDGFMLTADEMFAEGALQGITAFASSDDNGGSCPVLPTNGVPESGPPEVSYPATSPYVIAVGGTALFTNADFTYNTEIADYFAGGGVSALETAPFWQAWTGSGTAPIVPTSASVQGGRGVPDVSMCSDPNFCGAIIYTAGAQLCCVGGTSLSSPLAVGSFARIQTEHNNTLGYAGPLFYLKASGAPTLSTGIFTDIIAGCNGAVPTQCATKGWDESSGLGTFDIRIVDNLIPTAYH